MTLDLTKARPAQGHLFVPEREDLGDLMEMIGRFPNRPIVLGAEGTRRDHDTETGQDWAVRRERRSPAYTTRWEDLVTVYAR